MKTEARGSDRGCAARRAASCHEDVDVTLEGELLARKAKAAHTLPRAQANLCPRPASGRAVRQRSRSFCGRPPSLAAQERLLCRPPSQKESAK